MHRLCKITNHSNDNIITLIKYSASRVIRPPRRFTCVFKPPGALSSYSIVKQRLLEQLSTLSYLPLSTKSSHPRIQGKDYSRINIIVFTHSFDDFARWSFEEDVTGARMCRMKV